MLTKTEIEAMSIYERAKLAEMLWAGVPDDSDAVVEIPQWQTNVLEERLKDFLEHPETRIPWEQALAELKARRKHV
ncbi:MAG TPA: addiction module protein [Candidatus Kapabacteria bacterium]|nr:addiction module protein [Candidatus Kapabacteria bacterium]HYM35306.1 addiction module protein [Steroidobacteraceae bacterium]